MFHSYTETANRSIYFINKKVSGIGLNALKLLQIYKNYKVGLPNRYSLFVLPPALSVSVRI